jgi:purine-nucleoside phosphorylase
VSSLHPATTISERLAEAVTAIHAICNQAMSSATASHAGWKPEIGIILGSGLGDLADEIKDAVRIPYRDIPHFPLSTVPGHAGQLVLGKLEGRDVMVYQGRVHFYEGYTMPEVTYPVRLMQALGAHTMLCTNAVGGINENLIPGDLTVIRDHINHMGTNPLIGHNDDKLGPRFPRMDDAYDADLCAFAHKTAQAVDVPLKDSVYLALSGPSYETKSEIRFFKQIGADTVGMSTVPEVIVARHGGLRVLGISCVTNALHGGHDEANHAAVVAQAKQTAPRFSRLVHALVRDMPAAVVATAAGSHA